MHPLNRGRTSPLIVMFLCIAAALVLLVIFIRIDSSGRGEPDSDRLPAVGKPLIGLRLEPLLGAAEPLAFDKVQGQITLINFWGTWCQPCHLEMPHILNLRDALKRHDDFALVSVSCGHDVQSENLEDLRHETDAFLEQKSYRLAVHTDPKGHTRRAILAAFGGDQGFVYPTTVLLDRQGIIRHVWPGYWRGIEQEMHRAATELLVNR